MFFSFLCSRKREKKSDQYFTFRRQKLGIHCMPFVALSKMFNWKKKFSCVVVSLHSTWNWPTHFYYSHKERERKKLFRLTTIHNNLMTQKQNGTITTSTRMKSATNEQQKHIFLLLIWNTFFDENKRNKIRIESDCENLKREKIWTKKKKK